MASPPVCTVASLERQLGSLSPLSPANASAVRPRTSASNPTPRPHLALLPKSLGPSRGASPWRHPRTNDARFRTPLTPRHAAPVFAAVSTETKSSDIIASLASFFKRLIPSPPLQDASAGTEPDPGAEAEPSPFLRKVTVLGSTGRTGKHVVAQLLKRGHSVTALVTSADRAKEVLQEDMGLPLHFSSTSSGTRQGVRVVEGSLDSPEALQEALQGNDSVICCLGGRRGAEGYTQADSPEAVLWQGLRNAVKASKEAFADPSKDNASGALSVLLDFGSCREVPEQGAEGAQEQGRGTEASSVRGALYDERLRLPAWRRMDDVIMGGQSESILRAGNGFAVFEGFLRVEGGGFCGTAPIYSEADPLLDASGYDGLRLRVRGDGRRYKLNLRDKLTGRGELVYQASFDTVDGQWVEVFVPFSSFRAMQKARRAPDAEPINLKELLGVQFLYSRFQYDGFPNPLFEPGAFRLEIESVALERRPRPQFVLLSSAAVERSARAETKEERAASIPIVQLNPSGVLSWKLAGEDVLRASGLGFTIIRPCGLTDKDLDKIFLLESSQGDALTGLISREETAETCVRALESPYSINTSFELRRDEYSVGLTMDERHWRSIFSRLRPDIVAPLVQYPAVPPEYAHASEE